MHPYFENMLNRIYISHHRCSYDFDSHFQNKIEIAYCFSGMQKVRVGEAIFTLCAGDAVCIFPNIVHGYIHCETPPDMETEVVALMSDVDFFASVIPDILTKQPMSPFVGAEHINADTKLAFRRMVSSDANSIELLGWGCIAIAGIIRNMEFKPIKFSNASNLAPTIISYIDSNFSKNLSIKSIAAEFGYSPSYIAHVFHDQLNISFRTYLGSVRSEYAKEQILKSDKNLTEISYECGYNSLNTFCRCFKKHFGIAPSQMKKTRKMP